MAKRRTFTVKLRLDGILVEVTGVREPYNDTFQGAIEKIRNLCLMRLTKEYKGMKVEHIEGQPRVVGVETSDAWPD